MSQRPNIATLFLTVCSLLLFNLIGPSMAFADMTLAQVITVRGEPSNPRTSANQSVTRSVVSIRGKRQRKDDFRGGDVHPHLTTIFDQIRHRRLIINWPNRTYFADPWNGEKVPRDGSHLLQFQCRATEKYKMILGHRTRCYNISASGMMLKGDHLVGNVWIAPDLPNDIPTGEGWDFSVPGKGTVKGHDLEAFFTINSSSSPGELRRKKGEVRRKTISLSSTPIRESLFSVPAGFRKVKTFQDVFGL